MRVEFRRRGDCLDLYVFADTCSDQITLDAWLRQQKDVQREDPPTPQGQYALIDGHAVGTCGLFARIQGQPFNRLPLGPASICFGKAG